ncbi:glycogenin 1 isoform X6 [Arctopsyche grandis]|uniref:glycogenin 1 isoform X6 n=1 Tax=Arctopsyche grandis TaxID=121162 RepID=UPI00406D7AC3
MTEKCAWVTLATNDSYCLGALVLAHSLRKVATKHNLVVLITPGVTDVMKDRLQSVFSEVITVDVLDSKDAAHLALLSRPELGITFTKIHCWTLIQYQKCVFLDADTLVFKNCDELFEREELSAAPDVGWPDCFNSGVFVFQPSNETFDALVKFAQEKGSFDGGDQGLLNQFFSGWAREDIKKHLPFAYNVCTTAFYSYLPALKQYGSDMKIMHFIGNLKPWLQKFNWSSRSVAEESHLQAPLQYWWDIFLDKVHPCLDSAMAGLAGSLSQLSIGSSEQGSAVEEHLRRQGWEAGNIDYMGADAFSNIWAKISQTLSSPPAQAPPSPPSTPAPSTPPVTQAVVPVAAPVETPVVAPPVETPVVAPPAVSATPVASTPPVETPKEVVPSVVKPVVVSPSIPEEKVPKKDEPSAVPPKAASQEAQTGAKDSKVSEDIGEETQL